MNMGIGFSEILLIVCLIVLFFGTKELPRFLREGARLMARARTYTDRVRRELDELARPVQEAVSEIPSSAQRKKELRRQIDELRAHLTADQRRGKSEEIHRRLVEMEDFRSARAVMAYVSAGPEVDTHKLIRSMLKDGKRVVVPYCITESATIGLGWIEDFDRDLAPGALGILEPVMERRDNFFKSDLQFVVCPGVAFDRAGGRLGRGKGYYDKFLNEIRGRIPLVGLAFDCQILPEPVPFDYHDVPMTEVVTESGPMLRARETAPAESSPAG